MLTSTLLTFGPVRRLLSVSLLAWGAMVLPLAGCATSYSTPGGPADFRALGISNDEAAAMTDASVATRLNRKPLAAFPATIAVVRVQDRGYRSYSGRGYGDGVVTVVTTRDVETQAQFDRIATLPMIRAITPVNRLVLPAQVRSELDLRGVAASVQADMMLLYTFDTQFGAEKKVPALGFITLGLFPDREAMVTSTASAALIDTRNGYVYALAEATAKADQLANAWSTREAIDQSRRRAETEAFDKLVAQFEPAWKRVVATYAVPAAPGSAAAVPANP